MCVPWELNPQPFALLTQCSTTEPQELIYTACYFKLRHSTHAWFIMSMLVYLCIHNNIQNISKIISSKFQTIFGKLHCVHLKFSSWNCSSCSCSWLCFLPDGVLGSSKVSSWLARSVKRSFSTRRLFLSSCSIVTCLNDKKVKHQGFLENLMFTILRHVWPTVHTTGMAYIWT